LCCSGFFVFLPSVKLKPFKSAPVLIAFAVIALVCELRLLNFDFFERLERVTYDMRARHALKSAPDIANNLGFVFIDEDSLRVVKNGSLGYKFGQLWPRQVYGRLIQELTAQGAEAVAIDVVWGELRTDHAVVQMANGRFVESDDFLAMQMRRASNVIIALSDADPPDLFQTNALALGDINTEKDPDGILRRVRVFRTYRHWHPKFNEARDEYDVDLDHARIEPRQLILTNLAGQEFKIPLDADGNFDLADLVGDKIPEGMARKDKPFTDQRVWHMGIVLAAHELKLDLANAVVDLPNRRVTLRGPGVERVIPVDEEGFAYIDWCILPQHPSLTKEAIQGLLAQNRMRLEGRTEEVTNRWRGKLVVVGSSAVIGNNLTDRGATPISKDTLLVGKHWNVANSILTGRFVQRSSLAVDLGLIALLSILAAVFTWEFRVLFASSLVAMLMVGYSVFAVVLYTRTRIWIPLIFPLLGGLLMTHVSLVTWRVVVEQAERRRIRTIFSKVVSPKIVQELVQAETFPSLEGARREITVLFADVRGFTELTDRSQEKAEEFVRDRQLSGSAATACFDEQARETLGTVNLYLGLVADTLIKQDGTHDKYIGDCVMAFWGAPTTNPKHAVACVHAAIAAQRAIYDLNRQRSSENKKREAENLARVTTGLPPLPLLPVLLLGSGINTGIATAGLMGSQLGQQNYTVFGREVNLASRLEGASGRGRIFIGGTTFQHLLRDDPALAGTCVELPPQELKGFRTAVKVYEVPWRPPGAPPLEEELSAPSVPDTDSFTKFVQHP
jgi:class 3 adenylate cyclase/CHASE2 domain-containing sensor protein